MSTTARLLIEAQSEQRRQTIVALHRRIARLEEMLARRDATIEGLRTNLRTARARLRRIGAIAAARERRQVEPVLRERAVGES